MAVSEPFTINASIGTTEYSVTNNSTTVAAQTAPGCYQLFVDTNPIADGDSFEVRVYEKTRSASTQRCVRCWTIANAQGSDNLGWCSEPMLLLNGWDYTIKKIGGTDRTLEASVRKAG